MSEDTTAAANTVVEVAVPTTEKIDKGVYVLEEVKFREKTALAGLSYYVLQYKATTEDEAKQSLTTILGDGSETNPGKWKASQLIGVINSAVRSAQRVKAQNQLTTLEGEEFKKEYQRRLTQASVLLTPEEAESWVPGERELTIQGLMREIATKLKEGKPDEARQLMEKLNAKVAEEISSAEEA